MVTTPQTNRARQRGVLMVELLVAIALLLGGLLPIAYAVAAERRLARASYQRAVAMELVDGELELLSAGGWHAFTTGTYDYKVHGAALTNLPPGKFVLTVSPNRLRLEWQPALKRSGGSVVREVRFQ